MLVSRHGIWIKFTPQNDSDVDELRRCYPHLRSFESVRVASLCDKDDIDLRIERSIKNGELLRREWLDSVTHKDNK